MGSRRCTTHFLIRAAYRCAERSDASAALAQSFCLLLELEQEERLRCGIRSENWKRQSSDTEHMSVGACLCLHKPWCQSIPKEMRRYVHRAPPKGIKIQTEALSEYQELTGPRLGKHVSKLEAGATHFALGLAPAKLSGCQVPNVKSEPKDCYAYPLT